MKEITNSMTAPQLKYFISDVLTRVNKVAFELDDDENYTKDDAVTDLEEIAQFLDENYPRK
jgi:hypothetical protein